LFSSIGDRTISLFKKYRPIINNKAIALAKALIFWVSLLKQVYESDRSLSFVLVNLKSYVKRRLTHGKESICTDSLNDGSFFITGQE